MAFGLVAIALFYTFTHVVVLAQGQQTPLVPDGNESRDCRIAVRTPAREILLSLLTNQSCTVLSGLLRERSYNQDLPTGFAETYFSQQQREVTPACVILPNSAEEVSQVLRVIRDFHCTFAVKSGGHGMFVGASNAQQGITIDLRHLNGIHVSENRMTTSIGAGNRWADVYKKLEPMNLTVVGGRDTQLGVGGFILGGGISFLSHRYGWALDNVRNFEVVLANGSISNISYLSQPDLYFALRGGGKNFGIVTRFDLETFSQGPVWGGHNFYLLKDIHYRKLSLNIHCPFDWTSGWFAEKFSNWAIQTACRFGYCSTAGELVQNLEIFARGESGSSGDVILSFAFVPFIKVWVACLNLLSGLPEPSSPVFKDFEAPWSVFTTKRVANLTGIMSEIDWMNAPGYRQSWTSATFKMNTQFMSKLVDIYISEINAIKHVTGLLPSLIMQIITRKEMLAFQKNGGNALGITDTDGPLLLINNAIRWNYAADDDPVQHAAANILQRSIALAKEMGVYHRFIYQNYANYTQDVFAGYSPENRKRLIQIQRRYDPDKIFERLQPGYFKL